MAAKKNFHKKIIKIIWLANALILLSLFFYSINYWSIFQNYKIYFSNFNPSEIKTAQNSGVPILYYHHVRRYFNPFDPIGESLSITPEKFEEQMRWLFNRGYQTITPDQLSDYLHGQLTLDKKPIVLSFDDGYEETIKDILPILKKYNFVGVFYIIPGFLNKTDYLRPEDIIYLDQQGMVIGSHADHHLDLTSLDYLEKFTEIEKGKVKLETLLGHAVDSFAYPYGKFDSETIVLLKKLGFKTGFTISDIWSDKVSDFLVLPRIKMEENTQLDKILF